MLYIIDAKHLNTSLYRCFDTNTESSFDIAEEKSTNWIVQNKITIENAKVINNKLAITKWFKDIHDTTDKINISPGYIFLCKLANNMFKVVNRDGKVSYLVENEMREYIRKDVMANCKLENNKIVSIGAYSITNNTNFDESITEKYKIYRAKTTLIGYDMSFNYNIEGDQVKLHSYTGKSKQVIIPNFITTIKDRAFWSTEIETITLNNELKNIGDYAFARCNISEIVIPDKVEFMGKNVFFNNKKLINRDLTLSNKITMPNMVDMGVFYTNYLTKGEKT